MKIALLAFIVVLAGCEVRNEKYSSETYCDDEGVKEKMAPFILQCVDHPAGGDDEGDNIRSCRYVAERLFCRTRGYLAWNEYIEGVKYRRQKWMED